MRGLSSVSCINCQNVTFTYPGANRSALQETTCSVAVGEHIVLLGENGCGKSTLARVLAGLLFPFSGALQVLGHDLSVSAGRCALRRLVGIVFQSPDEQMVATTVEREIAFGMENQGVPSAIMRERVEELLQRFSLQAYAKRSPHLLSGGEKQRLALAAVLALDPQLLILDEVTSLLDPAGRLEIRQLIISFKGERTIVQISQFSAEALAADRVFVMRSGNVACIGTPQEVLAQTETLAACGVETPLPFRLLNAARS